jgi:hypothetical protein
LAEQNISTSGTPLKGIMSNTIRNARLKLLFIAAKAVRSGNRDKIKYSIHDARTSLVIGFLQMLDQKRLKSRAWENSTTWPQRFAI